MVSKVTKVLFLLSLLSLIPLFFFLSQRTPVHSEFQAYLQVYNKQYSESELTYRLGIYTHNARYIQDYNARYSHSKLAINAFADLTDYEFSRYLSDYSLSNSEDFREVLALNTTELPLEMDWRDLGAVSPVRDQRYCGACYAFAAAAAVESAEYLKTGVMKVVSTQELVDCSVVNGNHGCSGGKITSALKYIETHGVTVESEYPYVHYEHQECYSQPNQSKVRITGYTTVPKNNQLQLKAAVAQQPVAVAIQADEASFRFYSQGVVMRPCGNRLNHAVLVVGYGTTEEGVDYWIAKNSWGRHWGEEGFVRIYREDLAEDEGVCGIAQDASYVTTSSPEYS